MNPAELDASVRAELNAEEAARIVCIIRAWREATGALGEDVELVVTQRSECVQYLVRHLVTP